MIYAALNIINGTRSLVVYINDAEKNYTIIIGDYGPNKRYYRGLNFYQASHKILTFMDNGEPKVEFIKK